MDTEIKQLLDNVSQSMIINKESLNWLAFEKKRMSEIYKSINEGKSQNPLIDIVTQNNFICLAENEYVKTSIKVQESFIELVNKLGE
jgi:hypothetical protein